MSLMAGGAKPNEVQKSWKKVNEERKALKKLRKQEKLLKQMDQKETEKRNSVPDQGTNYVKQNAKKPNPSTVSIAVPGSILENAQSAELRTYVAGQIARAACIFRVSEVIVFDDIGMATARETKRNYNADDNTTEGYGESSQTVRGSCLQLARILQYLECPQYMRKFFFPLHKDLTYSGLLNPLDAPHHLRQQNLFRYREGIVTEKLAKEGHCYVNVGLLNDVLVNKALTAGLRVTVKLDTPKENSRKQRGSIVSPDEPRRETGVYWGYTVRIAHSIAEIFSKSPYSGGYDLTVGTSDRGANIHNVPSKSLNYNHLLIVFGGIQGLEAALAHDEKLKVDDPEFLFDKYINVLPQQGSRTIRTEEALLIAMSAMQDKLNPKVEDIEEEQIKEALPRSEDTSGNIPRPAQTKMSNKRKRTEDKATIDDAITQTVDNELQVTGSKKNKNIPLHLSANNNNGPAILDSNEDFEVVPTRNPLNEENQVGESEDLIRFD